MYEGRYNEALPAKHLKSLGYFRACVARTLLASSVGLLGVRCGLFNSPRCFVPPPRVDRVPRVSLVPGFPAFSSAEHKRHGKRMAVRGKRRGFVVSVRGRRVFNFLYKLFNRTTYYLIYVFIYEETGVTCPTASRCDAGVPKDVKTPRLQRRLGCYLCGFIATEQCAPHERTQHSLEQRTID